MSKLSKYRPSLNRKESAELLSRLIDEKVTEHQIHELFFMGWLSGHYRCNGEIVRLEKMLNGEKEHLHQEQILIGNYFVEDTNEVIGQCWGIHHPAAEVLLHGRFRILALQDEQKNIYGVRDLNTKEFYGTGGMDDFLSDICFTPDSIIKFSKHANNNDIAPDLTREYDHSQNESCIADAKLFPFYGADTPHRVTPPEIRPAPERASNLLVVASLIEIATKADRKKYNQASLIGEIVESNKSVRGLSQSTLEKTFAAALKALDSAKKASV